MDCRRDQCLWWSVWWRCSLLTDEPDWPIIMQAYTGSDPVPALSRQLGRDRFGLPGGGSGCTRLSGNEVSMKLSEHQAPPPRLSHSGCQTCLNNPIIFWHSLDITNIDTDWLHTVMNGLCSIVRSSHQAAAGNSWVLPASASKLTGSCWSQCSAGRWRVEFLARSADQADNTLHRPDLHSPVQASCPARGEIGVNCKQPSSRPLPT